MRTTAAVVAAANRCLLFLTSNADLEGGVARLRARENETVGRFESHLACAPPQRTGSSSVSSLLSSNRCVAE